MNILIQNENYKILESLSIDIIKTLTGDYSKTDLNNELSNLIYNKIIIDITAIRNYYDSSSVLDVLSIFDPDKVIILLNNSELVNSQLYINTLVKNGYYNFTRNSAGIVYLIDNPNSLNDVQKYLDINNERTNYNKQNEPIFQEEEKKVVSNQMIIGIENLTEHAGATTLMYLMVNQLRFNYSVKGIEMFKQDSVYFRDKDLTICMSEIDLKNKLKTYANIEAIIVDLNGMDSSVCNEVLYLVEPGIIRLNKMVMKDPNIYDKLMGKKVVINRSSIKTEDISDFEYETKLKIFHNLPNVNDRNNKNQVIDNLLVKLGFKKQQESGFLSMFK